MVVMEPTRRQLPREAKTVQPPAPGSVESYLYSRSATQAARKFLNSNTAPGDEASKPSRATRVAAALHLYDNPGDFKLFEGQPAPKGKRAK